MLFNPGTKESLLSFSLIVLGVILKNPPLKWHFSPQIFKHSYTFVHVYILFQQIPGILEIEYTAVR